jgi:3-oxoacyl-[acyl-carrier protein] reductase
MIDPRLKDKVVLVTGANHGIGAATAKAFAAQGAAVFITYLRLHPADGLASRSDEKSTPGEALYALNRAASADQILHAIRDQGGRAEAWEADLSDPATVPQLFDRVEEALGPVDVLVNNAAHWETDTLIPPGREPRNQLVELWTSRSPVIAPQSHDRHFAVNSRAVALMMAEYARRHIERNARWGRIINVSTDGAPGFPGEVSYCASKAALESYSRAAAQEFGQYGITVNILSPGPIQTDWITPELERTLLPTIPLGRMGQPEDVADVILFLASEQARWLTGQQLFVGGGHRMI